MYELLVRPALDKKLKKLLRKNPKQHRIICKKLEEITMNPYHFKNLRYPLHNLKRVHIDRSFVLTFSVDENKKQVTLEDLEHHDNIYI